MKVVLLMKENILIDKSIVFASRIVKLHNYLTKEKKEHVISKQIIRSGTSIGANINEANYGQSRADFIAKLSIALKETSETKYWLRLLKATGYLSGNESQSVYADCVELEKILVSILKSTKQ